MITVLPELEVKQAFAFFAMGKKTMNLEGYLNGLKNLGIILNKQELKDIQEKTDFTEQDFLNRYNDKMKQTSRDELLKVFQAFDPESTGEINYEVFHRAITTYGEKFSKEEATKFMNFCNFKPNEPIKYNDILDELVRI